MQDFASGIFGILFIIVIILIILLVIRIKQKKTIKFLGIIIAVCICIEAPLLGLSQRPVVVYSYGQEAKSGDWSLKLVDTIESTKTSDINSNIMSEMPIGQTYVIVQLQMTNVSSGQAEYSDGDFTLVNKKDNKTYEASRNAMEVTKIQETINTPDANFLGMNESINPGIVRQGIVVFYVPTGFNIADGILVHKDNNISTTEYYIKWC